MKSNFRLITLCLLLCAHPAAAENTELDNVRQATSAQKELQAKEAAHQQAQRTLQRAQSELEKVQRELEASIKSSRHGQAARAANR